MLGYTCCLIDDDPDEHEIFMLALKDLQIPVDCYSSTNAPEVLQKLANESIIPDYIFLDLNMPLINGFDCLKRIRQMPHLNRTYTVMYSTSNDKRSIDTAMSLGADDYLVKPACVKELSEQLARYFEKLLGVKAAV